MLLFLLLTLINQRAPPLVPFRSPKLPGSGGLLSGAGGSGSGDNQGQEPILPAVLEFPETHQELFLRHIISELDVNVPHFKLAPVYSLYLCAR